MRTTLCILPVAALAATASIAWISGGGSATDRQQGTPPSLATPEHKLLQKYAGTWDAEVTMPAAEGKPAEKSPAKETARVICDGLWLVSDFEGAMMGGPFAGHEVLGYDATAKHYTLTWVDSMSSAPSTGNLAFDAKTNTLEGNLTGRDPEGKAVTWRQADVWKDDNTREWTMYMKGPDGKENVGLQITYKRHK